MLPLETFGKNCQVLPKFHIQTQSQATLPKMISKAGSRRYEQVFGLVQASGNIVLSYFGSKVIVWIYFVKFNWWFGHIRLSTTLYVITFLKVHSQSKKIYQISSCDFVLINFQKSFDSVLHNHNSTLKYLINEHKKQYLIKEHCGILKKVNKRTCWNAPNKRTCWHFILKK